MAQHNLTREEAAARAALVTVQSYDVTLVLDGKGGDFRSVTTIRFSAEDGASTFIDAIAARIDRIELNGVEIDPATAVTPGRIALDGLAAENTLLIDGRFAYMNTGEGLHRFVDPVDDEVYLYTQFEVPDSRRVFAVFEQPDLKASFSFTVLAPESWTVVSNSPTPHARDAAEIAREIGEDARGLAVWQFAPTPRISSYITAIVAGPYRSAHSTLRSSDGDDVELGVYARASLFEHVDAENIFEITRAGFAFYEEVFGTPYPFEKYDQLFVPEFNAGAMENAGAVTIVENYVFRSRPTRAIIERRAVTILHELAHMWFGDLVTMRWWNDLWLNESFAEFMSTLATAEATEFSDAWTTFATMEKSWAYRQDQLPSTHPIVAPIEDLADVEVNFDGITYAKGASVLKQLVAWVGRDEFFAGVTHYFGRHAWSNTELRDLLDELEATSGRDLGAWSRLWLEESGVNLLRAHPEVSPDGNLTSLRITQEPFAPEGQPLPSLRPHRVGVGFHTLSGDGRFTRTAFHEVDLSGESSLVPIDPGTALPDVIVLNDDDLTYAKVRMDPASLETALQNIGGFTDSLTQLTVLSTVWDMVRDAELSPLTYIDTLCTHLASIDHSSGLLVQLRQLSTAVNAYLPPQQRRAARTRVAEVLSTLYQSAEPGSDQQLQFFQAFVTHATSTVQLATLESLLTSGGTPAPGLRIDTDMRWLIIVALAGAGLCDADAIESWLAEDDTAAGRRSAQTARFAAATPEAKTAAFDALLAPEGLPNAMVAATTRGFVHGIQTEDGSLVPPVPGRYEDFATEYFDRVAGWWETRTLEIAQTMTLDLYPPASEASVEATRTWLEEHTDAPKGLVRLMRENLDTAVRSLRCQQEAAPTAAHG